MKKTVLIGSILILLALSAPFTVTQGLSVGDDYWFEVEQASGNFEYNDGALVNGSTNKFRVGTSSLSVGDIFRCDVDALPTNTVEYSLYSEADALLADISVSSLSWVLTLMAYAIYPFIAMGISGSGSVIGLDPTIGVGLGDIFYIAPPTVDWNGVFDYYNNSANWVSFLSGLSNDEGTVNGSSYAKYYDNDETLSFFMSIIGNYVVAAETTDLIIIHTLRFDYNVTSNVLQGYDLFTGISGDFEGTETTFSMSAQVKEENYSRKISVHFLFAALGVLSAFSIAVILRKRK
ncbi:MAG: choice-of-anchor S family protein [Candidatus Heimdallarchaeota archaeon]